MLRNATRGSLALILALALAGSTGGGRSYAQTGVITRTDVCVVYCVLVVFDGMTFCAFQGGVAVRAPATVTYNYIGSFLTPETPGPPGAPGAAHLKLPGQETSIRVEFLTVRDLAPAETCFGLLDFVPWPRPGGGQT